MGPFRKDDMLSEKSPQSQTLSQFLKEQPTDQAKASSP